MRHCLTYDVPYDVLILLRTGADPPPPRELCSVHQRQANTLLVTFVDSEAPGSPSVTVWVDMLRQAPLVPRLVYQP